MFVHMYVGIAFPLGKFEQLVCEQAVGFRCARDNFMENAQIDQIPHRLLTL